MTEKEMTLEELRDHSVVLSRQLWRQEFETHLTCLAKMADPDIESVSVIWTYRSEDRGLDHKAAKAVYINYDGGSSKHINVNGDSIHAIVADVWRHIA